MRAESPRLSLDVASDDGEIQIAVAGELDLVTAATLRRRVLEHLPDGRDAVTLDLTAVTFIDSTGLRALLMLRADLSSEGRRLVLRAGEGPVVRLLRLTGTAGAFHVE